MFLLILKASISKLRVENFLSALEVHLILFLQAVNLFLGGCVFSGRIHSVKSWLGGIFSVRAKVPKSNPNLWPALWITASDRILLCFYSSFCPKELVLLLLIIKEKWPICGEIDIMETWGNNSHVMGTLHCGNSSGAFQILFSSFSINLLILVKTIEPLILEFLPTQRMFIRILISMSSIRK